MPDAGCCGVYSCIFDRVFVNPEEGEESVQHDLVVSLCWLVSYLASRLAGCIIMTSTSISMSISDM